MYENLAILNPLEDEERLIEMIKAWIRKGQVEEYAAFRSSTSGQKKNKRRKKAEEEAKEAEIALAEITASAGGGGGGLGEMIRARSQQRMEEMINRLEEKYSNSTSNSRNKNENKKKRKK